MNKLVKFTAALTVGLACLAHSAHADTMDDIKARKKILIGVDIGTPPFGSTDANMQPQGSEIDVARAIAKDMGLPYEFVHLTAPNRIPYLLTRKADIVVSVLSITPERAKLVDFSKPHGALDFVIMAPKSSDIKGLNDLVGKRVATVRGNIQDTRFTPLAPKGTTIVRFDDDATAATALVSGQVDALCAPSPIALALAKQQPQKQFENKFTFAATAYAIGLRKNDPALKAWLDNWVTDNRKNGQLAAIYKRWIGADMPDLGQFD